MKRMYGWRPSLPDPRDFRYKITQPVPLPDKIDLSGKCPPIYNQGSLGSCTANALAAAYEFNLIKEGKTNYVPSRLFIYYSERSYEGTIRSDAGAALSDGMKVLNKIGVCNETLWPYNIGRFRIQPSNTCFVEALKNRISLYERLDNSSLTILQQCLAKGFPFVFGFTVFSSFESQDTADSGIMNLPDASESKLGGHAVLGVGYDNQTKMVKVRNSWGAAWGDHGYFYMPYEYITNQGLASDFWAIDAV